MGQINSNLFLMNVEESLKSFFVFTLLILIVLLESCNQAQKQPPTQTVANPSQSTTRNNLNTYISNNPLAAGLVRVGKEGIETGDDKVLDAYFPMTTGKPVAFEVINTFRYNAQGLLAEEWVQLDNISFLKQFGLNLLKR